ncbi:MAG: tetratricopeptide repeat protein [Verrucomicrobia bacterium]|nr:tetratricopeptide repeat protein [Verrucomicrobiota bacterium]
MRQLLTACCFVLLLRASVADQRTANVALQRATNAFNQGRLEEAEKQLDAAERADSKKPEVPNLRGVIFTTQKRYDEAAQQFNEALALDPKFYPAKLNLAEVRLLEGQYADAAQEYQALKEADPASETLDFKLVLCALLDGKPGKASGIVDLMMFPGKTPAYYYARAAIALQRGDKPTAQKYFENVKKYYSDEQCRYFAQSLKEVDLSLPTPSRPEKTPDPHSGDLQSSETGSE